MKHCWRNRKHPSDMKQSALTRNHFSDAKHQAFFWCGRMDSVAFSFPMGMKIEVLTPSSCIFDLRIRFSLPGCTKRPIQNGLVFLWWGRTDSNHRSETQQIYSLSPLATRELPHIQLARMEPVDGLVQSRNGSVKPSPATLVRVAFESSSLLCSIVGWSR